MMTRLEYMNRIAGTWRAAVVAGFALLLGCLVPAQVLAVEQTGQVVRDATTTWLRQVITDARPDANIDRLDPWLSDGEIVAYVAHLEGGGFCLCGADDLSLPVYLYAPQGQFDPDIPDMRYILSEIEGRLMQLRQGVEGENPDLAPYAQQLADRARMWQDLAASRVPLRDAPAPSGRTLPDYVALNVNTTWHQRYPFNDLCPMGDGGRCAVGCVATAGAQIMKYREWPVFGQYSYTYDWDGDDSCGPNVGGGELYASFGDGYAWADMPEACGSCSPEEEDAVAELSYEIGVSVEMDYGNCGSGAFHDDLRDAFETFFRYDPDATHSSQNVELMTRDIAWLRPLALGGDDVHHPDGPRGHSWVVHGYDRSTDPDRLFLMNFGWGGSSAWFACDNIDIDGDSQPDFWDHQDMVTQVAPLNVRFVGGDFPGDGSPDSAFASLDDALMTVPDNTTLVFLAGSHHEVVSPPLVINQELTLWGYDVEIE